MGGGGGGEKVRGWGGGGGGGGFGEGEGQEVNEPHSLMQPSYKMAINAMVLHGEI